MGKITEVIMGVYIVTINIKRQVEEEWLQWMKQEHIPDIMNAGFFTSYEIFKVVIPDTVSDEAVYQFHYRFNSIDDYYQYAEKAAPEFQRKHSEKFLGKFKASRAILKKID